MAWRLEPTWVHPRSETWARPLTSCGEGPDGQLYAPAGRVFKRLAVWKPHHFVSFMWSRTTRRLVYLEDA